MAKKRKTIGSETSAPQRLADLKSDLSEPPPPHPEEDTFYARTPGVPPRPIHPLLRPGRPRIDPDDLRTDRYGLRMHPDLRSEIDRLARADGMRLSQWLERLLVTEVNRRSGVEVLDWIGRYKDTRKQRR